jgi:glycosyltransferase involved in cell wall biosynthesis
VSVATTPITSDLTRRQGRVVGILSTYPPTPCGLATFSAALARGLEASGTEVGVVRLADGARSSDPRVLTEINVGVPASVSRASMTLNECDVALVQHDYGLYGGADGEEVLEILHRLTIPSIVVAHTVLLEPTDHQREVLEAVASAASIVVVMALTARRRLCSRYDVDPSKVIMIPHGAVTPPPRRRADHTARPLLLTWGLLGPGKGIESVIDAMADLKDLYPAPRYVVAGSTHPKVRSSEGEAYRDMLMARARSKGVESSVTFDPAYRDVPSLTALIQDASVVVLPYESRDQVTSGVLVDAIAAGTPVVATAFPHAVELLSSGAGMVVPHGDAIALGAALRLFLTEPARSAAMAREAARLAPGFGWPAIGGQYADLADSLLVGSKAVSA